VREKNVGKKSTEKIAKNVFLYSHEYRAEKIEGKTREKFFPETQYSANKKCCEKIEGKSAKNVFYIHTNIEKKNSGTKTRETNYPEKQG